MTPMNIKSRLVSIVATLILVTITTGCTFRVADLTLISTKNIDLSTAKLDIRKGRRVKGEDCVIALLGLIPFGVPNLEEAVDHALVKGNGNIMVDQVTYQSNIYFILASRSCIKVEGTVINSAETR